eukprot:TRINITY_DN50106_c0_g1_i1.p1 TRINITY_DN50106_c0_g1~~TRINITY_DN50106_c0_g1_i1.p1  ORF type:complete len:185 (+),score=9.74 TRINITY_DN50106_c0_g1_i1:43-597(+)
MQVALSMACGFVASEANAYASHRWAHSCSSGFWGAHVHLHHKGDETVRPWTNITFASYLRTWLQDSAVIGGLLLDIGEVGLFSTACKRWCHGPRPSLIGVRCGMAGSFMATTTVHYLVHCNSLWEPFRHLAVHHHAHHCDCSGNFSLGMCPPLLDRVLGTELDEAAYLRVNIELRVAEDGRVVG